MARIKDAEMEKGGKCPECGMYLLSKFHTPPCELSTDYLTDLELIARYKNG